MGKDGSGSGPSNPSPSQSVKDVGLEVTLRLALEQTDALAACHEQESNAQDQTINTLRTELETYKKKLKDSELAQKEREVADFMGAEKQQNENQALKDALARLQEQYDLDRESSEGKIKDLQDEVTRLSEKVDESASLCLQQQQQHDFEKATHQDKINRLQSNLDALAQWRDMMINMAGKCPSPASSGGGRQKEPAAGMKRPSRSITLTVSDGTSPEYTRSTHLTKRTRGDRDHFMVAKALVKTLVERDSEDGGLMSQWPEQAGFPPQSLCLNTLLKKLEEADGSSVLLSVGEVTRDIDMLFERWSAAGSTGQTSTRAYLWVEAAKRLQDWMHRTEATRKLYQELKE